MAADRIGHPHEAAGRCGELRTAKREPRVEHGGEVVERAGGRAVCAQREVLRRRDVLGEAVVLRLAAHDMSVGI